MQHEAADTDLELVYNSTHSAAVKERLGLPAQEERVQLLFEVGRELYLLAAEFDDDNVVMQPMLQIAPLQCQNWRVRSQSVELKVQRRGY